VVGADDDNDAGGEGNGDGPEGDENKAVEHG
jgi:hypothetical protein